MTFTLSLAQRNELQTLVDEAVSNETNFVQAYTYLIDLLETPPSSRAESPAEQDPEIAKVLLFFKGAREINGGDPSSPYF